MFTAGRDKYLRFFEVILDNKLPVTRLTFPFKIDGKVNELKNKVFIENFPISKAAYSPNGSEVVITGNRTRYYVYNTETHKVDCITRIQGMSNLVFCPHILFTVWTGKREPCVIKLFEHSPCGRYLALLEDNGVITLLHSKSKTFYAMLKMNGTVEGCAFTHDGSTLYSIGSM
jgi:U3 small nucleolar RNA-associated protein 18